MAEFLINTTDFGIDPGASIFELVPDDSGGSVLTLEIEGGEEHFDRIKDAGGEEWSWATFPPSFYLRDFPIPAPDASGIATAPLDRMAYRTYEVALYMMEHNTVEGTIKVTGGKEIEINGQVDLIGKRMPFQIRWSKSLSNPNQ